MVIKELIASGQSGGEKRKWCDVNYTYLISHNGIYEHREIYITPPLIFIIGFSFFYYKICLNAIIHHFVGGEKLQLG